MRLENLKSYHFIDTGEGVKSIECLITLTNNGEVTKMIQGTEYKFPVLNLKHGNECFNYSSKLLQYGGDEKFDANELKFANLNENKQIFLKIVLTIWL
jgi:hypothetical protein